jgi:hypothetical protein
MTELVDVSIVFVSCFYFLERKFFYIIFFCSCAFLYCKAELKTCFVLFCFDLISAYIIIKRVGQRTENT